METEIPILGGAGLRGTQYSTLLITDMSRKLDELFGFKYMEKIRTHIDRLKKGNFEVKEIDDLRLFLYSREIMKVNSSPVKGLTGEIVIPVSREVDYNFRSARSLMVAYHESERVVDYFYGLAKKVGFFFALPYKEILRAGDLSAKDVEVAVEDTLELE